MLNEFYDKGVNKAEYKTFLALLNPFPPHITEELWQQLGETGLLSVAPWPTYDEAKTVESTVEDVYKRQVERELDALLESHELVKGKVLESAMLTPRTVSEALCEATGADAVQCLSLIHI